MSAAYKPVYTPEEYLAVERLAAERSEYIAGETFNMAGATRHHNLISRNAIIELDAIAARGGCEAYAADMKVWIPSRSAFLYPDTVVTYEPQFLDGREDVLLNPRVVVEVLSPSTESYDRGTKTELYRSLPSLRDLLLVSQDEMRVTHHTRVADGWESRELSGPEATVTLSSFQSSFPLSALYRGVDLGGVRQ